MMRFIRIIISILVVAGLCAFVWMHRKDMRVFYDVSVALLVPIALAQAASIVLNGTFLRILLNSLGVFLHFSEFVALSAVSSFSNILFPFGGGFGVKVIYLRVLYALEFARFAGLASGLYIIIFCANSVAGLLLLAGKWHTPFGMTVCIFLGGVAVLTGATILLLLWDYCRERLRFLGPTVGQMFDGLSTITGTRGALAKSFAVAFGNILVFGLATYLEFAALGGTSATGAAVSLKDSFLLSVVSSFSLLVSITPAGLGVRESISIIVGNCMGISEGQVLAVCLLDRAINFIVLAAMGGVSYYVLQARVKAVKSSRESASPR